MVHENDYVARCAPVLTSCSTTHGREADSAPSSFLLANKSCFWHRRKRGKSLTDYSRGISTYGSFGPK